MQTVVKTQTKQDYKALALAQIKQALNALKAGYLLF